MRRRENGNVQRLKFGLIDNSLIQYIDVSRDIEEPGERHGLAGQSSSAHSRYMCMKNKTDACPVNAYPPMKAIYRLCILQKDQRAKKYFKHPLMLYIARLLYIIAGSITSSKRKKKSSMRHKWYYSLGF